MASEQTTERDGMAVLHGYDPETGKVTTDVFLGSASTKSPWHRAHALLDSVRGDFPGWIWSVGQDDRSRYLMYVENMRQMGLGLTVEPFEEWLADHGTTPAKRTLLTEPHDGHPDAEECPGCPHDALSTPPGAPS